MRAAVRQGPESLEAGEDAAAWIDATCSRVFASLGHLTAGDRSQAEELLIRTYLLLHSERRSLTGAPPSTAEILLTAHRLYLKEVATAGWPDDDGEAGQPVAAWASPAEVLAAMSPTQRALLNLCRGEGLAITDVAGQLGIDEGQAQDALDHADALVESHMVGEPLEEVFRRSELWLDDALRAQTHKALTAPQKGQPTSREAKVHHGRVLELVAVVAAVGLFAVIAVWISAAPDRDGSSAQFDVASTSTTNALQLANTPRGGVIEVGKIDGGTYPMLRPVLGASGEHVTYLAPGLTNFEEVRPDVIVRYSNGAVGMTWTGPCNRPVSTVQFASLADGIGVRLTTGEFPVVSCLGMPERWTVVVHPQLPPGDGEIVPLVDGSGLEVGYQSSGTDQKSVSATVLADTAAGFGSTLVDGLGQPWVFATDCPFKTVTYLSAAGPLFEARINISGQTTPECAGPYASYLLRGPDGRRFPQAVDVTREGLINCQGPYLSPTDVPVTNDGAAIPVDGVWATWDGCVANPEVIYSSSLTGSCSVYIRSVTFNAQLGKRIRPATSLTYVRDPLGRLPDSQAPLEMRATLPADAEDTGFRFEGTELWRSPSTSDWILIVTADHVERWPLLDAEPTCD